jgi:hypothetical protein
MKILIVGDSFAADWSVKEPSQKGWPNMLADRYIVVNLAQAGVSEYKIWKQISACNLTSFSHVIVCHTSPYRIPVERHPLHHGDILHGSCDLMYEDIKNRQNKDLLPVVEYFEKWFDIEYARFVHQMIIDKEIQHLNTHFAGSVLHVNNFGLEIITHDHQCKSFYKIFLQHNGPVNHFDYKGNSLVAREIISWIEKTPHYGSSVLV